ncbi:MAG: putative adaptin ear-binding coat-associated protein 2 [Streblomastix strix]|uniref:Putative adaptin ear-binding coat-associated protein 2 n=1 Tax=Streblomastix strix TaxID=222440 RepID=A0A5J4WF47_9EUKA|nr:MAG: putative adaptin ear-binding coat-associated protein 2 [Streblomastix strix]
MIYKIGPRPSVRGYLAKDWKPEDNIWSGRVVVKAQGESCTIKLEDPKTGELFATAPLTEFGPSSVERVLDSSRYFVIRIDDGQGHHAFVGIGFEAREDGFDFMHSIGEHFRRIREEKEIAAQNVGKEQQVEADRSLQPGQKIKLNLKLKGTSKTEKSENSTFFAPPPQETNIKAKEQPKVTGEINLFQQQQSVNSAPQSSFFQAFNIDQQEQAPSAPLTGADNTNSNSIDWSSFFAPTSAPAAQQPEPTNTSATTNAGNSFDFASFFANK